MLLLFVVVDVVNFVVVVLSIRVFLLFCSQSSLLFVFRRYSLFSFILPPITRFDQQTKIQNHWLGLTSRGGRVERQGNYHQKYRQTHNSNYEARVLVVNDRVVFFSKISPERVP